jgi:predicted N-acyltransferase
MGLHTEVVSSIEGFAAGEWEAISGHLGLYVSRPYLAYAEHAAPARARYVTCRSDSGALMGALPAYECSAGELRYDYAEQLTGRDGEAGPDVAGWYPGLLGGSRTGYLNELCVDPSLEAPAREEVVRALLAGLQELAEALGARSYALPYLTPEAAEVLHAALHRAPGAPELLVWPAAVDADLPLAFDSFDGYLQALSRKRRYAVRREVAGFAASGQRVEVLRLSECYEALAPLAANNLERHGTPETPETASAILDLHARFLDDRSMVFTCREASGRLLGFSLFFAWDGWLYARAVGFDYDRLSPDAATYFNLLFYEPIALALERGLHGLHLGLATEAKAMRGARIRPFWCLVRPPAGVDVPAGASAAAWNERQQARSQAEYGGRNARFDERDWALVGPRPALPAQ